MATPTDDPLPLSPPVVLHSYELPSSPCRSPTGSDNMSVWVEEASDGEPRVRVALTDDVISRSPRLAQPPPSLPMDVGAASLPSAGITADRTAPAPWSGLQVNIPADMPPPASDFPLVLVGGDGRVIDPHSPSGSSPSGGAGQLTGAIVPFQKLQMDTNLHQTTLPPHSSPSSSRSNSPTNGRHVMPFTSNAFHGSGSSDDALAQNFMDAMRLGDIMRPQEPQLSVRLRGSRVELASASEDDAVDFLGPAENIKKLFKLPYSQGAVSLAVHVVGSTLVVDGEIDAMDLPPGFADDEDDNLPPATTHHKKDTVTKTIEHEQEQAEHASQQILYEKFIYQSALAAAARLTHDDQPPASTPTHDEPSSSSSQISKPHATSKSARHHRKGKSKSKSKRTHAATTTDSTPSSSFPFDDSHDHTTPTSTSSSASFNRSSPMSFQRVLQWKFNDLKMFLGSDVLLFSNAEHPAVSLRLHDMDKELSLATVLDYYLDNVIANIPELAICMHSKGVVRGYKLVETRQIPYMSGNTARPLFDVQEVSLNASMLLKFLKNNCTRPNGTYWLHRKQGEHALRLYDVNVLSQGKQLKWKYMMAMLCYRFAARASRMLYSLTVEKPRLQKQLRVRQRELLRTCVNLLTEIAAAGGAAHNSIRSSVAEQLADTYLSEPDTDPVDADAVDDTNREGGERQDVKVDALVQAKTYLAESIRLFEACIQADSSSSSVVDKTDDVDGVDDGDRRAQEQETATTATSVDTANTTTSGGLDDHHDDEDQDELNAFMQDELLRLQLKCRSICLQLALLHLQSHKWHDVVGCIREAAEPVAAAHPSSSISKPIKTTKKKSVDELLASIDFDGVRRNHHHQSPSSSLGGATRDTTTRVCLTKCELRCFALEVVGDAASKQLTQQQQHDDDQEAVDVSDQLVTLFHELVDEDEHEMPRHLPAAVAMRTLAFHAYLKALFPAVDSELYFRLMKKLGNACNELGKHFLSPLTREYDVAFQWFARGCRVFKDIEDSVNVALLSANLAHLHKLLAQQQDQSQQQQQQQQHYAKAVQLCLDASSLLKHHKMDENAALYRQVRGELALSYLVWGVSLANSTGGTTTTMSSITTTREADALKKYSKALALYTEIGDVKQAAATHYQIASFHMRCIARDVSNLHQQQQTDAETSRGSTGSSTNSSTSGSGTGGSAGVKNRLEIARRHYERALEYFGRRDVVGPTFVLIHQELADLYAMGGRQDDLDHALLVLLNTVHAFRSSTMASSPEIQSLGKGVVAKLQTVLHQLIRMGTTTMATTKSNDLYKRMYKEVIYFVASMAAPSWNESTQMEGISAMLTTLEAMHIEVC